MARKLQSLKYQILFIMNDTEIIAKNIRFMREANHFPIENVATFLGVDNSTYLEYESGTKDLSLDEMENLSDLYGCDGYLMYEENLDVVKQQISEIPTPPNLCPSDMKEIAHFKKIVKAYLKMKRIAEDQHND